MHLFPARFCILAIYHKTLNIHFLYLFFFYYFPEDNAHPFLCVYFFRLYNFLDFFSEYMLYTCFHIFSGYRVFLSRIFCLNVFLISLSPHHFLYTYILHTFSHHIFSLTSFPTLFSLTNTFLLYFLTLLFWLHNFSNIPSTFSDYIFLTTYCFLLQIFSYIFSLTHVLPLYSTLFFFIPCVPFYTFH